MSKRSSWKLCDWVVMCAWKRATCDLRCSFHFPATECIQTAVSWRKSIHSLTHLLSQSPSLNIANASSVCLPPAGFRCNLRADAMIGWCHERPGEGDILFPSTICLTHSMTACTRMHEHNLQKSPFASSCLIRHFFHNSSNLSCFPHYVFLVLYYNPL